MKCRAASHPLFSDLPSDDAPFPTAVYQFFGRNYPNEHPEPAYLPCSGHEPLIAGRPGGSDFGVATRRVARPLKQRQAIIMGTVDRTQTGVGGAVRR